MISLDNIKKNYDDNGIITPALRGVTFDIKRGEFVSIMGPSGSGKSTLLHILSYLDRPSHGKYLFDGRSIHDLSDLELARIRNKQMGFVFQSFNLLSRLSVYDNVEIPLVYSDIPAAARRARILHAVDSVGLGEKINMEAGKLSGGQKQRVAIARALVNDPDVIFADEPTGNLDSVSGAQVMKILDELHKKGKTVVLVTHETYTAEFGDRLIRIKDGSVESDKRIEKKHNANFFK